MAPIDQPLTTDVTYEDLASLEHDFDDADQQLLLHQEKLMSPLYAKRATIASRIPNFWALVLEQAPTEFDQFITPTDSQVFAECLEDVQIERFEVEKGEPRSLCVRMRFRENQWFRDVELVKRFYSRRSRDGWVGLVSEPVAISWKSKEMDLTGGLTDAAVRLWKARLASANKQGDKPAAQEKLKEHQSLAKRLESNDPSGNSFFTFFGFVSERRWVSAVESEEATQALKSKRAAAAESNGKQADKVDEANVEDEELELARAEAEQSVEICPHGSELATVMAEDIWPHAIRYFTSAQEQDDEELSEADFEEDDDDESDDEIDIRALVKGKGSKRDKESGSDSASPPPAKNRKK